jgi:hypothetical protein
VERRAVRADEPRGRARGRQFRVAKLLEDRWILSRLAATRDEVSKALEEHRYNDAATELYRFVWNDFCDWYLEIVKPRMLSKTDPTSAAARGVLARVLTDALALLHPFTPYMTEVLSKALNEQIGRKAPMLMDAKWPDGAGIARDATAESEMETIQGLVRAVRSLRLLTGIAERKPLTAKIAAPRAAERAVLAAHAPTVQALAFLDSFEVGEQVERPPASAVAVAGSIEVFVPLGDEIDLDKLRESLVRRCEKVKAGIAACDAKLGNAAFVERADPGIVEEERSRRAELALELVLLEKNVVRDSARRRVSPAAARSSRGARIQRSPCTSSRSRNGSSTSGSNAFARSDAKKSIVFVSSQTSLYDRFVASESKTSATQRIRLPSRSASPRASSGTRRRRSARGARRRSAGRARGTRGCRASARRAAGAS